MNEQEREVREPVRDSTEQAQAAPGAAPSAPPRERERNPEPSYEADDTSMGAIDERAATTKTEPMARVAADKQAPERGQAPGTDGSGTPMQDQRWEHFAGRWEEIQSGFVDDPRRTVERADGLVGEVIDHLAKMFREERARLESQWSKSGKVETEDLRLAMQRYRDFFRTLVGR
jgi:hypothetical protein